MDAGVRRRVPGCAQRGGPLQLLPERHDLRGGLSPASYDLAHLLLGHAGMHRAVHALPRLVAAKGFQCSDASAVSERELRDLSLLPEIAVLAVLDHRNVEHLRGGGAVDVAAVAEDLHAPFLPGEPRCDAGLDRGEVCHHQLASRLRYNAGADELGQDAGHVVVQACERIVVSGADELPCLGEIRQVILRQVLYLKQPPCPSPGVCAEELHRPMDVRVVVRGAPEHGVVLGGAGLCEHGADGHELLGLVRLELRHHVGNGLLVEGHDIQPLLLPEPALHLCNGARVVEPCECYGLLRQLGLEPLVHLGGVRGERPVYPNPSLVDACVEATNCSFFPGWRPRLQKMIQLSFCHHVLRAI